MKNCHYFFILTADFCRSVTTPFLLLHPCPQVDRSVPPPVPHILETPRRQLTGSWAEYELPDGSGYFYNVETGVSSWQLPPPPAPAQQQQAAAADDDDLSVSVGGRERGGRMWLLAAVGLGREPVLVYGALPGRSCLIGRAGRGMMTELNAGSVG